MKITDVIVQRYEATKITDLTEEVIRLRHAMDKISAVVTYREEEYTAKHGDDDYNQGWKAACAEIAPLILPPLPE